MPPSRNGGDDRVDGNVPVIQLSDREAAKNYGSIAAGYHHFITHQLPSLRSSIDQTEGAALAAGGHAVKAYDEAKAARKTSEAALAAIVQLVSRLEAAGVLPESSVALIPPMRDKMASAHDIEEAAKKGAAEGLREEWDEISKSHIIPPPPSIPSDRVKEIIAADRNARVAGLTGSVMEKVLLAVVMAALGVIGTVLLHK